MKLARSGKGYCYVLATVVLRSNVAVLAAEITSLASLRLGGITNRCLATLVGVKVSAGARAVSVGRHRLLVDVVH